MEKASPWLIGGTVYCSADWGFQKPGMVRVLYSLDEKKTGGYKPPVGKFTGEDGRPPLTPYAALLAPFPSKERSLLTLTLICFGLASAFFASLIFNTPLS